MPITGTQRCTGCDCRTVSVPADPDAHDWPCCENFTDSEAPCHYIVKWLCDRTVTITGDIDAELTCPVMELRKVCWVGCEWVCMRGSGDVIHSACLTDQTANALQTFPPAASPPFAYHAGDYGAGNACIAPQETESIFPLWTLEAAGMAAGDVTLTLTSTTILAWAALNSLPTPVYSNVNTWEPFGSNSPGESAPQGNEMIIDPAVHPYWPMLPRAICVEAMDDTGASANPCDTHEHRCGCCDFQGDTATFGITVDGCEGLNGCQVVTSDRISEGEEPAGVTWPGSTVCDAWPVYLTASAGCSDWSGEVLILFYCTGSTLAGAAYCYSNVTEEWEHQGSITVTSYKCITDGCETVECGGEDIEFCCTWLIGFTVPPLECCCDTVEDPCCETPMPISLTASDGTNSVVITHSGGSWTVTPSVGSTFAGCTFTSGAGRSIALQCFGGGVWYFAVDDGSGGLPATCSPTGTCDPVLLTCSFTGCDSNVYTITITE